MARTGKTSPSRIQAQEKRRKALQARRIGMPYDQIAQVVGYSDGSAAYKAVNKAFAQIIQEPVQQLKVLQVERLNQMLLILAQKVQAGDEKAIMTSLAVMDKLDRLEGTEAATKSEVRHTGNVLVAEGDKEAFIAALAQMAGVSANGTNLTAHQEGPSAGHGAAALALNGVTYPPGMAPGDQQAAQDVVDAEVVEETPEKRDVPPVDDVPKATGGKSYRFGVDPTVTGKS